MLANHIMKPLLRKFYSSLLHLRKFYGSISKECLRSNRAARPYFSLLIGKDMVYYAENL